MTRNIMVDGHRLRLMVTEHPGLPWLMLWPGLGGTAEEFLRLHREGPTFGWNVASIDPPGHGLSEDWDTWNSESALLVWDAVIGNLSPGIRPVIGGHSAGAFAALTWAARHLGEWAGLVLLDGGYSDPLPAGTDPRAALEANQAYLRSRRFGSWAEFLAEERQSARSWDDDIATMLRATMTSEGGVITPRISLTTANQVVEGLAQYHVDQLPILHGSALLLLATEPPEMDADRRQGVATLKRHLPGLEVVPVPGAGHDLMVDNPVVANAAVWRFLKRLGSPSRQF